MTNNSWEEIDQAYEDGRHELHLNGDLISQKLKHCGGELPSHLFDLTSLNYLEISDTTLSILPAGIGKLSSLLNLALHRNKFEHLPDDINSLTKLKFMDVSNNQLKTLPQPFSLPSLHTLNLSNNQLESLPDFSELGGLSIVFIDHNDLTALPPGVEKLSNLSEIHAASNEISCFPANVKDMSSLKHLDLSENSLKDVSCDFSECRKLKTLDLKNNPLKDNRLKKMTLQCSTKAILEYLAKQNPSGGAGGGGGKKKGKNKKGKAGKKDSDDEDDVVTRKIHVLKANDDNRVEQHSNVKDTRPYICCTIIKNLDLSNAAMFKSFITLQTKLHETVCDMRTRATIATHNFEDLKFPLSYEASLLSEIDIVPLGKEENVNSAMLINNLKAARDNLKQQKKRQHKTGLYKFIELVDGKEKLACLRDVERTVVSLPPITNSEKTKISPIISDVFIEITSPMSLPDCKFTMEEIIKEMFKLGLDSKDENMMGLVVEPVRVFDENGDLKIIYPSKIDLNFSSIGVVRVE